MSLTAKAKELRSIAAELEAVTAQTPKSAEEAMRRYAPAPACMDIALDLRYLGHEGFDVRRSMVSCAGAQLGRHIAEKITYELADGNRRHGIGPYAFEERYRAEVYAFTRGELLDLIRKVFDAARLSQ